MHLRISKIIFLFPSLLALLVQLPQEISTGRIRGSNPAYEQGDWISYSVTRYVTSIAIGNQFVYFGTTGGILQYDFFSNRWDFPWTTSDGLADNAITAVAFDFGTGYLWCGTRAGISYYQPAARRWTNLFKDEIGLPESDNIISIGAGAGDIWLQSEGGRLFQGDRQVGAFVAFTNSSFTDHPDENILWFGKRALKPSEFPQLFISDGYLFDTRGYIQDFRLRRFPITCSVTDRWGTLWLGTWGLGAAKADLRTSRLDLLPFGPIRSDVKAVASKGTSFWLGGQSDFADEGGVTEWDRKNDKWLYYESRYLTGFNNDQVNAIASDGENLWFGTEEGLVRFNRAKDRWQTYGLFGKLSNSWVNDVVVDDKSLWVATNAGLNRIEKATLDTDSLKLEDIDRTALRNAAIYDLEPMQNLLWMGTEYGIYVYDQDKKVGGFYAGPFGPVDRTVTAVSRYRNEVWFGTLDGVEAFDVERKIWLPSPARNYYSSARVNFIRADSVAVWVGTEEGALKFNRKGMYWRLFTTEDGLLDNSVQAILLQGDYIWFGTAKGLTRFYWNDPNRID